MVRRIKDIVSIDLDEMLEESQRQGFAMIDRLIREWASGENDFGKMNEALFAYEADGRVVGIGGVNQDPYLKISKYGRMRHLYVLKGWRRKGVGSEIVRATIAFSRGRFKLMTLRTPADGSVDAFYERFGFRRWKGLEEVSHIHDLRG